MNSVIATRKVVCYRESPDGPYRQALTVGNPEVSGRKLSLNSYPLLIELRSGLLFWMLVKGRCAPDQHAVYGISETLEKLIRTTRLPKALEKLIERPLIPSVSLIENEIAEAVGLNIKLLNTAFADISNWPLDLIVADRLVTAIRANDRLDAGTCLQDVETDLNACMAVFTEQLDGSYRLVFGEVESLDTDNYNYFIGPSEVIRKYRQQAASVMPLAVRHALTSNDDSSFVIRRAIDRGQPLIDVLAKHHEVSRSVVKKLIGVRPDWFVAAHRQNFSAWVRLLDSIEPDFRPKTQEQWMQFSTALASLSSLSVGSTVAPSFRCLVQHIAKNKFVLAPSFLANIKDFSRMIDVLLSAIETASGYEWHSAHGDERPKNLPAMVSNYYVRHLGLERFIDLSRRYQDALRREEQAFSEENQLLLAENWPSPLAEPLIAGDYFIVPLLSIEELNHEGRVMNNCVSSYPLSCADGSCQLFSVRNKKGKSVSCIETSLHRGIYGDFSLRVEQHAGRNNSDPAAELEMVIDELVRYVWRGNESVEKYWNWKTRIAVLGVDQRKAKATQMPVANALRSVLPPRHSITNVIELVSSA